MNLSKVIVLPIVLPEAAAGDSGASPGLSSETVRSICHQILYGTAPGTDAQEPDTALSRPSIEDLLTGILRLLALSEASRELRRLCFSKDGVPPGVNIANLQDWYVRYAHGQVDYVPRSEHHPSEAAPAESPTCAPE